MAEIKIEKKKPVWPWIILVLIILMIAYIFWNSSERRPEATELNWSDTITQQDQRYVDDRFTESGSLYSGRYGTIQEEQTLADYFKYLDERRADVNEPAYHQSAIQKLTSATEREGQLNNVDIQSNISGANTRANELTGDAKTATAKVKNAAEELGKALKKIQEKAYSSLKNEAEDVQNAVSQINAPETLENQEEKIHDFYDKAAKLLQKMYEERANR